MNIIDEALLNEFRWPGLCEWCKTPRDRRHPHHIFSRGMGGKQRLDIRINLVGLCPRCHVSHHDGNRPSRAELLVLVAKREGESYDAVLIALWGFRRAIKERSAWVGEAVHHDRSGTEERPEVPAALLPAVSHPRQRHSRSRLAAHQDQWGIF